MWIESAGAMERNALRSGVFPDGMFSMDLTERGALLRGAEASGTAAQKSLLSSVRLAMAATFRSAPPERELSR